MSGHGDDRNIDTHSALVSIALRQGAHNKSRVRSIANDARKATALSAIRPTESIATFATTRIVRDAFTRF